MTQALTDTLRNAVDRLPAGLREHVLRVEEIAGGLASTHGLEPERLRVAALAHDLVRHEPPERLLELAREAGLEPDGIEAVSPILLHGPIAARMLERDYGVADRDVLAAVANHTTAAPDMSAVEKCLFLADKIDPHKIERKPALAEVRELAWTDMDAAVLRFLNLNLLEAVERGWLVHPRTVAARNQLVALSS